MFLLFWSCNRVIFGNVFFFSFIRKKVILRQKFSFYLHMFIHKIKRYNLIRITYNLVYSFNVCVCVSEAISLVWFFVFLSFILDYYNLLFGCRHSNVKMVSHFCTVQMHLSFMFTAKVSTIPFVWLGFNRF